MEALLEIDEIGGLWAPILDFELLFEIRDISVLILEFEEFFEILDVSIGPIIFDREAPVDIRVLSKARGPPFNLEIEDLDIVFHVNFDCFFSTISNKNCRCYQNIEPGNPN